MFRRTLISGASTAIVLGASGKAWSQAYPTGPVKIIVPYAPGGSSDIYARLVAGELSKRLRQPVTVENQPGGGGAVGLQAALRAAPDGRTLLSGQPGEIVLQPYFL